eukprot:1150897-Pelagomonas_calceolata.AAC.11
MFTQPGRLAALQILLLLAALAGCVLRCGFCACSAPGMRRWLCPMGHERTAWQTRPLSVLLGVIPGRPLHSLHHGTKRLTHHAGACIRRGAAGGAERAYGPDCSSAVRICLQPTQEGFACTKTGRHR